MPNRKTAKRQQHFIQALERGASISNAARCASVHRSLPYKWAKDDPAFARSWEQARDGHLSLAQLIDLAFDLALQGHTSLMKFLITHYDRQPTPAGRVSTSAEDRPAKLSVKPPFQISIEEQAPDHPKPFLTFNGAALEPQIPTNVN